MAYYPRFIIQRITGHNAYCKRMPAEAAEDGVAKLELEKKSQDHEQNKNLARP